MENRVLDPVFLKNGNGKRGPAVSFLKEFPLPLEIGFEGGEQEAFTKTPGTAEKVGLPLGGPLVHIGGFIHIHIPLCPNGNKILNADGHFSQSHTASIHPPPLPGKALLLSSQTGCFVL
jgi:hypothetical protein